MVQLDPSTAVQPARVSSLFAQCAVLHNALMCADSSFIDLVVVFFADASSSRRPSEVLSTTLPTSALAWTQRAMRVAALRAGAPSCRMRVFLPAERYDIACSRLCGYASRLHQVADAMTRFSLPPLAPVHDSLSSFCLFLFSSASTSLRATMRAHAATKETRTAAVQCTRTRRSARSAAPLRSSAHRCPLRCVFSSRDLHKHNSTLFQLFICLSFDFAMHGRRRRLLQLSSIAGVLQELQSRAGGLKIILQKV